MKTIPILSITMLCLGLAAHQSLAAANAGPETTAMTGLSRAEYFDLESEATGGTYRIFVAKPQLLPDKKYPVIYVLDGNGRFGLATAIQRMLERGREIPAAFVVGVGYAGAHRGERSRDYTPTTGGEVEAVEKSMFDPQDRFKMGGGPAFLEFLRGQLKPAIESAYPADSADATIVGHSLGGLFASWTLLNHPDTFQRYVIISPSIWWNREEVWQWEEQYAAAHEDLNATVFVTAGGLETAAMAKQWTTEMIESSPNSRIRVAMEASKSVRDKHGWPRMAEITPEFVDKLKSRKYPKLKIHCHNMPDETHTSVVAGAFSRGLRYVFGHWDPEH